jgi:hypothetical protein
MGANRIGMDHPILNKSLPMTDEQLHGGAGRTLADQVRSIARENELLAYTSAGNPGEPHASRRYAIRAGILHLAASELDLLSTLARFVADPESVEKVARVIKDEMGRQWNAHTIPGDANPDSWTATGGVLDLERVAQACLTLIARAANHE